MLSQRHRQWPNIKPTWSKHTASMSLTKYHPEDTRRQLYVGLMLSQHHRQWPSIKPTWNKQTVFAVKSVVALDALLF